VTAGLIVSAAGLVGLFVLEEPDAPALDESATPAPDVV